MFSSQMFNFILHAVFQMMDIELMQADKRMFDILSLLDASI